MALPAGFDTVDLHALGFLLTGAPAQGSVSFTMTAILTVPAASAIIYPDAIVGTFDAGGEFTVALPVSNDPDVNQVFVYTVTEKPTGTMGRTYTLLIDNAWIGTTVELANLAPAGPIDSALAYLTQAAADELYFPLTGILILGPSDPVPGGTPSGTLIFRTT